MKLRLQVGKDRKLRDRHGRCYGELQSITLDIDPSSPLGAMGSAVPEEDPGEGAGGGGAGGGGSSAFDPVKEVWTEYVRVMKPRSAALGPQERAIIRDALKVATIEECKVAIRGCAASRFHMGENDRHRKYNKLSQILKGKRGGKTTREQIDMFIESAEKSGLQSGVTSAPPARVAQAKRDVLDAWEFPNDEHVVARSNESREWLEEHGWKVIPDPDTGRPTFEVDNA